MIEMYRYIQASKVDESEIVLNDEKTNLLMFDVFFGLTVGLFFMIQVLSYNRQGLFEFIITLILMILVFIIGLYKRKLFVKTILFNRKKGIVEIKRVFPKIYKRYDFANVKVMSKKIDFVDEDGYRFNHKKYFLKIEGIEKEEPICSTAKEDDFDTFINRYMNSLDDDLIKYDRANDEEFETRYQT